MAKISTISDYLLGFPEDARTFPSSTPSKHYRYGQEPYFQESLRSFKSSFPDVIKQSRNYTYVLIKPDAFVARQAAAVIKAVTGRGFRVVALEEFTFDRMMVRELWRYEFNAANVARYRLIDSLLCSGPSLMAILEGPIGTFDSSQTLSALKGPSLLKDRTPDCIRNEINARTGTLNFIHTPDETIDFVRELGVLFDDATRARVLESMVVGKEVQAASSLEKIDKISSNYPKHTLLLDDVEKYLDPTFQKFVADNERALTIDPYIVFDELNEKFQFGIWDWVTLVNETLMFGYSDIPRVFQFECELDECS
ncbi:nucleoside-diphosphate kinase (plasmid) [Aquicoccus sp. G2-2]|uniref:nucleoside-diphosphate kinase n=1 Tax=Aquicoccus sp. G2-2 TaxID=3092120 RepID=UPI002AE01ACE|nr:nucleoside-diphosphate kinase [Aquicoccus sp. G2-2]MEA1112050.1 nucleoside-diphosphate kinase [Aquicoccus sp. G2-2]